MTGPRSVASAGDINDDGYADIVIRAPSATGHTVGTGAAYVLYGHAGAFADVDLADPGAAGFIVLGIEGQTGLGVSSAGDFDGDGDADLLIGALAPNATGFRAAAPMFCLIPNPLRR